MADDEVTEAMVQAACVAYVMAGGWENGRNRLGVEGEPMRAALRAALAEADVRMPAEWAAVSGLRVLDPDGWRDDGTSWHRPLTRDDFDRRAAVSTVARVGASTIAELIERSSLGTPAAVAARASVPDEVAAKVVARARELDAGA